MGALNHISEIFDFSHKSSNSKKLKNNKQLQTVEIKVRIDCEGCERRVKKSVKMMKGVTQVDVDPKKNKLTVIGYVDPKKVLHRVQHQTGKKVEFWPYVPYEMVALSGSGKIPPKNEMHIFFFFERISFIVNVGRNLLEKISFIWGPFKVEEKKLCEK
ncbi:heavy metal-associated isoprenylated plant protein 26-like [Telopea speciosissima]|uniref:heavy metal-associated isoprenylated plant protein 26-like n=1 Tax=Telopea speciosissima TaxID=54955 RepID=UPI001CC4D368|nr:heavy metal-associated isoprenylated plant protein 26-like [Telopea speciosissima]